MKRFWLFLLLVVVFVTAAIVWRFISYYAPPHQKQAYQLTVRDDSDSLRIAFIGDSWAFEHQPHDGQMASLLQERSNRPVKVFSYGICGLTSKEIYQALFTDKQLKQFLTVRHYDVCVLSAGINDTYKKMSVDYYLRSMDYIIQFMLENHIKPLILEIPDYDIVKTYRQQAASRKLLRQLSMHVNGVPMDCKQQFRNALRKMISTKQYAGKVTIIDYKSWNGDYSIDQEQLYRHDGMHLNNAGYARLDSTLTSVFATHP